LFKVIIHPTPTKVLNISTRSFVGAGDNVMIGGFIVTGTAPKKIIVRAIGPSLPLDGKLNDPVLELYDASGALLAANDNWQDSPDKQAIIATTIPPADPHESAILRTVVPGAYTAVLRGVAGATGIALVELYDLDSGADSALANISTRGPVTGGDQLLIAGVIVSGNSASNEAIRAIGPSLTSAGIANALADPVLELHDHAGDLVMTNDNWQSDANAGALRSIGLAPTNAHESALIQPLGPGAYTAVVSGGGNTTGVALVEVYAVP
jgi:hypothetical protein